MGWSQTDYFSSHSRFVQRDNFSFFGFNSLNKVGVLYNTIQIDNAQSMDNKYFFGALSFDEKKFSLGIDFNSYKIEQTGLVLNLSNLVYVYQVKLSNSLYFLPAISFGLGSKNILLENIVFEDQLNQASGFINSESIDPLSVQIGTVNYTDFGASFIIHNDEFMMGFAIKHLNRPNVSFNKESKQNLGISYVINGGYEYNVNPYENIFFPKHTYLLLYGSLSKQGNLSNMYLSQDLQLAGFSLGLNQQFSHLENFSMNNFGISVGLSLENFDIGLLYNFGIKNIKKTYAPSIFELYLTFDFSKFRRNTRGLYKRIQTDNYF